MKVLVEFKQADGHDDESFVINTTKTPKNKMGVEFLKAIDKALKSKDKEATFGNWGDYDFTAGLISKARKTDDRVTIWYGDYL